MNPRTLRFYEAVRLLPPPGRTRSGYRTYGDAAVRRLAFIRRAKQLGLTLKEIRRLLALCDAGRLPCDVVQHILTEHITLIDAQMAHLRGFKSDLRRMLVRCRRGRTDATPVKTPDVICPIIDDLGRRASRVTPEGARR